ncbi:MAG: hypothetical protein BHV75_02270 [Bacteroides oleiciplenus]|nr:MAG: hypothetical protein BHV75_02270 [Bacteroides oleiciplenus]
MKKIILIPSNTDLNRGDQALVWESIRLINDVFGQEKVQVSLIETGDNEQDRSRQNNQTRQLGYSFIRPILKHPSRIFASKSKTYYSFITLFLWGVRAILDFVSTRMLLSRNSYINKVGFFFLDAKSKKSLELFRKCDSVFVKGGGFLHSYGKITDCYLFYYFLFHIRLAHRYDKKVFVLPNSFGPMKNLYALKMSKSALLKCALVTVREKLSYEFLLQKCSVKSMQYPDLGFYLEPSEKSFENYLLSMGVPIGTSKKKILITLRPYRFPDDKKPAQKYDSYINSFAGFIDELINSGHHVTLFAHTLGPSNHENDNLAIQDVMYKVKSNRDLVHISDESLTCRDVEKIYSYYDYLIGTRFHSVIFALNVGIPVIAITYGGNKGDGIMKYFRMEDCAIPIELVTQKKLVETYQYVLKRNVALRANIINVRAQLLEKRNSLVGILQYSYKNES